MTMYVDSTGRRPMADQDKNSGLIVIVEGLWSCGKTTLARRLAEKYNGVHIPEPDHMTDPSYDPSTSANHWYFHEFNRLAEVAAKAKSEGRVVVMERCQPALLAYMAVNHGVDRGQAEYRSFGQPRVEGDIVVIMKRDLDLVEYDVLRGGIEKYKNGQAFQQSADFLRQYDRSLLAAIRTVAPKIPIVTLERDSAFDRLTAEILPRLLDPTIVRPTPNLINRVTYGLVA